MYVVGQEAWRVVHQIAGMHAKEPRKRLAALVREVDALAAFDLREIGLTEREAKLLAKRGGNLGLGHRATQPTPLTFGGAQVEQLFAKLHRAPPNRSRGMYARFTTLHT